MSIGVIELVLESFTSLADISTTAIPINAAMVNSVARFRFSTRGA